MAVLGGFLFRMSEVPLYRMCVVLSSGWTLQPWPHHKRPFVGAFQGRSWSHGHLSSKFGGHLSPKIDKVSEELTLRYPHEEPCVDSAAPQSPLVAQSTVLDTDAERIRHSVLRCFERNRSITLLPWSQQRFSRAQSPLLEKYREEKKREENPHVTHPWLDAAGSCL